jgi:galactosamine-6-phosphate isomerase
MKIEKFNSYKELSNKAKELIVQEIKNKPNLLLCTATGGSPTGTYELLGKEFQKQPELFNQLKIIKLDEWGGIPMNHPTTCETYLQTHLIQPLQIHASRYTCFLSNPENPQKECARIQNQLDKTGHIDICILGIGMNGHIAFNEPAEFLQPHCHIAKLSAKSLQHPMAIEMQDKPTYGLTLGIADILYSKKIIILINGSKKKEIVQKFLSKQITTAVPASFLWLHPNVICLIGKDALGETDK